MYTYNIFEISAEVSIGYICSFNTQFLYQAVDAKLYVGFALSAGTSSHLSKRCIFDDVDF